MTQHQPIAPNLEILVGGENLIDFVELAGSNGLPQYSANPGGSPFNVAIAAARQTCAVKYLTPVSTDRLGNMLAKSLVDSGVILEAPRVDAPTSLAIVSIEHGQPSYQFYRKDTAERLITRDGVEAALAKQPWAFHIGSLAISGGDDAAIWQDFFQDCHAAGVITSFDPNIRPALIADRASYMARFEAMIGHADIIKLSDEDIAWLYPEMEMMTAFDHLVAQSAKGLRVLTKGSDGAVARSAGGDISSPAHPVHELVDAVGAGDTFMASILSWLAHHGATERNAIHGLPEDSLKEMIHWAARAAALNCQAQGCNPPSRADIESLLNN